MCTAAAGCGRLRGRTMVYIRRLAGREVRTGLAVLAHVMRVDSCNPEQTIKQILQATHDDSSWWGPARGSGWWTPMRGIFGMKF